MKIEKLNHSKFKVLLYTLILGVVLIFIIGFETSKAAYRTTQSINIANGSITYSPGDLNIIAVKVQKDDSSTDESNYDSSDNIPTGSYALNTTKSYCTYSNNGELTNINTNMSYDRTNGTVDLTIFKKGTKCYLYFDIHIPSAEDALMALGITTTSVGSTSVTGIADTDEGIKYISDGMYTGTTYYYRGAVNNNWVKFAGMYWRIIRINGDGSIRMIYSGTTAPTSSTATVMTGAGTQTTTSAFNSTRNDAIYVGWKYTSNNGHGTGTSSTIRAYLVGNDGSSGWYSSSDLSSYASYIADGKFCNDRTTNGSYFSNYTSTTGYGTSNTAFAPVTRVQTSSLGWNSTQTISTSCTNSSDIFTEKVGLITSDEVLMAGGKGGTGNSSYYLYTNQAYWTLSSSYFYGFPYVLRVGSGGTLANDRVDTVYGVRPVINLKAGTKFTGSGTYDDVYKVVGTSD